MRLFARLLVLCLPCLSLPSLAAPLAELYQVREPVASQAPEDREQALGRALETLVIRLTGSREMARSPALAELRANPQQIVSQYGYEKDKLLVDFDPLSTERQLRQAGLPIWGANRPAILAWWSNDDGSGAQLVGDGQASAEPLRQAAQHRGLPLRLPLADLGEQLLASAEHLAASDPRALREASERYGADALLLVQAHQAGDGWQAQWRLWLGDAREQGKAQGRDSAALADAVLLALSERLAPRFVAAPGAASGLSLEVEGVNLSRYAELQRLLEPFDAQLRRVQGDKLSYRVKANPEQLRAQLALLRLREVPASAQPLDASQAPAPLLQPRRDVLRFGW